MDYGLSPKAFSLAFPFHIVLDAELRMIQIGQVLQRLISGVEGELLTEHFRIQRPAIAATFAEFCTHAQSVFFLTSLDGRVRLKGQMLYLEDQQALTYLCSPWVTDLAEIAPLGIHLKDFAIHDPISDYLLLLQSKNTALQDTKKLAEKLAAKQERLRITNAELQKEIAERIRIYEELERARDQAVEASRLKSEFLATMSHEIRTPMNGIMGMSELLLETQLDHEQLEYARIVHQEAGVLLRLLNDILDISKIEAGKFILEDSEFSLQSILEGITNLFAPKAQQRDLALITYIASDIPNLLIGDPIRIHQIFVNLLSNALKFTEEGEVIVRIRRAKYWTPPATLVSEQPIFPVQISVQDSGIGMSEAIQSRLFSLFVQGDGSTTRRYGGTGLGLAITKRLVEMMHGTIAVESKPGLGTTFTLLLPLPYHEESRKVSAAKPPSSIMPYLSNRPEPMARAINNNNKVTDDNTVSPLLLLVEDHKNNQRVALAGLRRLGYLAHVVENGQEAVNRLQDSSNHYAAVLMDWHMPEMDGIEATKQIRRLRDPVRHIPIIGMTANAMKGDRERCLEAGMDDYLSKPVGIHELQQILKRWVGSDRKSVGQ